METEPSAQYPSQKLNFGINSQKIRKSRYQSFLVLSNLTGFPYFIPNILSKIVDPSNFLNLGRWVQLLDPVFRYWSNSRRVFWIRSHAFMMSTKKDQFCGVPPHPIRKNERESHCLKTWNLQTCDKFQDLHPPSTPFHVNVINVWCLNRVYIDSNP